jgi:hypothetical protein
MMTLWQSMTRNWGRRTPNKGMGFFPAMLLGTGIGIAAIQIMRKQSVRRNIFSLIFPGNRQMQPAR